MSFFRDLPEPEPPAPLDPSIPSPPPEWAGPPHGVLPGLSDLRLLLFHTPDAALVLDRFCVFQTGIQFTAGLQVRDPHVEVNPASPWNLENSRRPVEPDQVFRFGTQFSDGTTWTNIDEYLWHSGQSEEPPAIVLSGGFGHHGPFGWEATFWLWPLPPTGPLTFVAAWPAGGIDETSQSLEADSLLELTSASTRLWDL